MYWQWIGFAGQVSHAIRPVATGPPYVKHHFPPRNVRSMAEFRVNEQRLVSGGADGKVVVWKRVR